MRPVVCDFKREVKTVDFGGQCCSLTQQFPPSSQPCGRRRCPSTVTSKAPNFTAFKVRRTDGVKGQRGFAAGRNVPRREYDLVNRLSAVSEPPPVQMVLKQQAVGQVDHAKVAIGMGRVPLKRG
jgi:hypothetical protein